MVVGWNEYLIGETFRQQGNISATRWGNHSSGEIIRRGKSFVGENHSSGKIIRRGKSFVAKTYSSGTESGHCPLGHQVEICDG